MAKSKNAKANVQTSVTWKNAFKRDWQLYLLLLFPLVMVIVFSYAAYPGLRLVFMDYKPAKGYEGSEWVGMATFAKIFKDADFFRALKNSIVFNLMDLAVGFPMPIILALMLNELRYPRFKKVTQTILYLPHFLSWVIIGGIFTTLLSPNTGIINYIRQMMGMDSIYYMASEKHIRGILVIASIWKEMGWSSIVYLAAIAGIDPALYEEDS